MQHKILIVEDEEMLSLILKDTLESKKFEVLVANDGTNALLYFEHFKPDLIVLDIMIPGISGYEVAKKIREKNENVPLIFLSAKSQTVDVLKGFDSGANDYMKKPFSMEELIARINVLLKSSAKQPQTETYTIGNYEFNYALQSITYGNEKNSISFKEAQLLRYLAKSINQTVEKEIILKDIWGDNNIYTSKNMDVVITKLRVYFKANDKIKIVNQRGVGYKLIVEE